MYKVGDMVRVVGNHTGHIFQIGDVVVLTNTVLSDRLGRRWLGNDTPCGWLSVECIRFLEEEVDLLELL
jgi:hypothetical protein